MLFKKMDSDPWLVIEAWLPLKAEDPCL